MQLCLALPERLADAYLRHRCLGIRDLPLVASPSHSPFASALARAHFSAQRKQQMLADMAAADMVVKRTFLQPSDAAVRWRGRQLTRPRWADSASEGEDDAGLSDAETSLCSGPWGGAASSRSSSPGSFSSCRSSASAEGQESKDGCQRLQGVPAPAAAIAEAADAQFAFLPVRAFAANIGVPLSFTPPGPSANHVGHRPRLGPWSWARIPAAGSW